MKQQAANYKRIVIKIGSSLLCPEGANLDTKIVTGIAAQISQLLCDGKEVVIVSSGAIALGMHLLGLKERPKQLHTLQAAAAIGQNELMNAYRRMFDKGLAIGQVLLTWEDFSNRSRYLNAKNTLLALLKFKSVAIVNENDTVSTEEIKFGDNDRLSALVASLVSADLLIILSDVDGLLNKENNIVPLVDKIDAAVEALACPTRKKTCVGGMITKIQAAKIAVGSGIPCVIANGRKEGIILSVIRSPQKNGTLFVPALALKAKQRWIAFGTKPKGCIYIDHGAKVALLNHKSLLSVGITQTSGDYASGEIVSVKDAEGNEFARGKVSLSAIQVEATKGKRHNKEVIHRDNIVIL